MSTTKFGVYLAPSGKLKTFVEVIDNKTQQTNWELDEGKILAHPIFRIRVPVVKNMTIGWPIFEQRGGLKNCEYLGEL